MKEGGKPKPPIKLERLDAEGDIEHWRISRGKHVGPVTFLHTICQFMNGFGLQRKVITAIAILSDGSLEVTTRRKDNGGAA